MEAAGDDADSSEAGMTPINEHTLKRRKTSDDVVNSPYKPLKALHPFDEVVKDCLYVKKTSIDSKTVTCTSSNEQVEDECNVEGSNTNTASLSTETEDAVNYAL